MKDFLLSLSFLTIIPIPVSNYEPVYRAFRFFPISGAIIGIFAYLFYYLFSFFLPENLSAVLAIFVYHIINGGLHLDGFADLFDGYFGSKKNKERFKEILKDSRIGAMGVFGLLFYFSIVFFAVMNVKLDFQFFTSLGLFGRLTIVITTFLSKSLFDSGLGKYFVENVKKEELLIAGITSFIISLFLGKLYIFFWFIVVFWSYLYRVFSNQYLGGVSGDILGAGCISTEIIFVLLWRAFLW